MSIVHKHHITPRHMGGDDSPENLVDLCVEDHAYAHVLLWMQYRKKQDWYAFQGLFGHMGKEEIIKGLISHKGKDNPFYGKTHPQHIKDKMYTKERAEKIRKNNGMKQPEARRKQLENVPREKRIVISPDGTETVVDGSKAAAEMIGTTIHKVKNYLYHGRANLGGWQVKRTLS